MTIPKLLVSVRDVAEAEAALAGGADLIDVKEPSRGALGRADVDVVAAVIQAVGGRTPVSAALGEECDYSTQLHREYRKLGLDYIKLGPAGLLQESWVLRLWYYALTAGRIESVLVAYADWLRAEAPPVAQIVHRAMQPWSVILLDTYVKDGSTLFDYLSVERIAEVIAECHANRVQVALAGSLGPAEIARLRGVGPDIIAVRGAACAGGREGRVDAARVRELAALVRQGR